MPAPIGNNNHGKAKRWSCAIERALARYATGDEPEGERSALMIGVDKAADLFVAQLFENKDLGHFKELGDRLDGKPAQSVDMTADITSKMVQATPLDEKI